MTTNGKAETVLRDATDADLPALAALHRQAFGGEAEARLVARLHETAEPLVSLLAEEGEALLGHVLFSPVTLEPDAGLNLMGLAPMAVRPERQRRGIGSRLVEAGLARCRASGCDAVIVLGHADYYPRFGFEPASRHGLRPTWDVPDEAFMALELRAGCLPGRPLVAHYHPAFAEL